MGHVQRRCAAMIPAKYIPNLITLLRFLLVPPLVWVLSEGCYGDALCLFALMGISDALDGFLAKRFDWKTTLGAYLDPLADKVMLVSAYVTLGWLALLPVWLVAIVIGRDAVILSGALAYHLVTRRLEMVPSYISKANTLMQIVLVLSVITAQLVHLPRGLLASLMLGTVLTTLGSGVAYVVEWSRRVKAVRQPDH